MVIGSYDKAKKFHPMALMITMHETGEDFKFFFSAINQHRPLFKPTTLIADAAAAITNGFQAVWSSATLRNSLSNQPLSKPHNS